MLRPINVRPNRDPPATSPDLPGVVQNAPNTFQTSSMPTAPPSWRDHNAASWILMTVMGLGVLVSFMLDWRATEDQMQSVARERGAALFKLVELTRSWNARHGGVYVPVTETTQPNPYLRHPRRDVLTQGGVALTLINPAFMTRQIAELAERTDGVRIHLTSDRPIRPENVAQPWEAAALKRFEGGLAETIEFVPGPAPLHRYMAPLRVEEECMKCHAAQGYSIGQIRGGISVSMPAQELIKLRDANRGRSAMGHALVFLLMAFMLQLLTRRTRDHLKELEQVNQDQERLISQRTASLSKVNAELEAQVAQSEVAATVFDHVSEAIVVMDARGCILKVNPAFSRLTGYAEAEALGRDIAFLKADADTTELADQVRIGLESTGSWRGEVRHRGKAGGFFVSWLSIDRVGGAGANLFVATLSDISARKEVEDQLRHLSQHDVLTGLPNRALFEDRLQVAMTQSQRHHRPFALMYLDLDEFKEVNDSLGHAMGDQLLMEAARRLLQCVRQGDTVARLGGDEFAIILPDFGAEHEIHEIASRIVEAIARPVVLGTHTAHVSASIGIAIYPQHGDAPAALKARADQALYAVKEAGRNGYRMAEG